MRYFLLVYDRPRGRLVEAVPFDNGRAALRARFSRERNLHDANQEVVVVSGDSLDSLRTTHGRYFQTDDTALYQAEKLLVH